jgi:hypothetical protein
MSGRVHGGGRRDGAAAELALAIGLVWGHLSVGQYQAADALARGCLALWPDEPRLAWMAAYAAIELFEPAAPQARAALRSLAALQARDGAAWAAWAALLRRRAGPAGGEGAPC